MTAYRIKNQIHTELGHMLPTQIDACKENDELPILLKEVILHNFQARFACYNKKDKTIEIGVEKEGSGTCYPEIKIYTYSLDEIVSLLDETYRTGDQDLDFYAKLIAHTASGNQIDEVVLV